jgi:hypothetical protein
MYVSSRHQRRAHPARHLVWSLYWLRNSNSVCVPFETFRHSAGFSKFPENGWLCLELVAWSNFSLVRTTRVREVRCGVLLISGGRLLSTGTDSNRCNGLARLNQGFTTSAKTHTVFQCRSQTDMPLGYLLIVTYTRYIAFTLSMPTDDVTSEG